MKKNILFLLFTVSLTYGQSQNGVVTYSFFANGAKNETKLSFNNNESIFTIKNNQINKKKG